MLVGAESLSDASPLRGEPESVYSIDQLALGELMPLESKAHVNVDDELCKRLLVPELRVVQAFYVYVLCAKSFEHVNSNCSCLASLTNLLSRFQVQEPLQRDGLEAIQI